MSEPQGVETIDRSPFEPRAAAQHARAIGSPLPMGGVRRPPVDSAESNGNRIPPSSPGRALPGATASEESSGMQRAMNAVRMAIPLVQRLLPLLDGNIATAIANVITARQHPQAPPPPKVDLAPIEDGLSELRTQHRDLRDQVIEQNTSLKRVEDQLEMVREATDRNTLEQQELLEDLKLFSNKVKIFAVVGIGLLAIGFLLNLILFLHIQRVLP
ncbi:MAG: hypothetical protein WBC92_00455 [Terracidiphilus sp.]